MSANSSGTSNSEGILPAGASSLEVQGSGSSRAAPPSDATSGPRARSRTPPVQVCRRPKKNAMVAADLLDQKCVTCKMPRHRCFQAGDWACALCGQHNYTGAVHCNNYKCHNFDRHAAPLPSRRQVQDSGEVWCISCQMWRSHCWKNNDWECPSCFNHNFARKQNCMRCGLRSRQSSQ